jgi:ABC-type transport system substrate-binding protein
MFKKQWFGLLILMMLALLLAACGGGAQPEVEQPADTAPAQDGQAEEAKESTATGGTVRVGWGGAPDTLNPGTAVVAESFTPLSEIG